MNRRDLLKSIGGAGLLSLAAPALAVTEQAQRATRGTPAPRIKDISVIECAPAGSRLTVVKITTDQDGLYGYGCGTFTQRAYLVKPAVEKYLKSFLLGKATDRIEDIWQSCDDSSYWKNGPVLNSALSGVDQALWDIKGRQTGMPVYQLVGGKCREAVDCYTHAAGAEFSDVIGGEAVYGAGLPQHSGAGRFARDGGLRLVPGRRSPSQGGSHPLLQIS
jgi:mannonate dehydratase